MNRSETVARLIFLCVGLSVSAYCIAEANWLLALIALPAWVMAWPVALAPRGAPLPRGVILLLVLAALSYSVMRVVVDIQDMVIAVSRLLLWLQLIKLYDRRREADRRQLLLMSVFLVVGACLTSNSIWLGAVLLVYLPILVWTVALHQIERAMSAGGDGARGRLLPTRAARRQFRWTAGWMGGGAFLIGVGIFVIVPRDMGEGFLGNWGAPESRQVTGFADSVRLGSAGLLSESRAAVMEVVVRDANGRNVGSADRSFLLRGAVLDRYQDGEWVRSESIARGDAEVDVESRSTTALSSLTQQREALTFDFTLHRRPQDHLFTVMRPVSITLDRSGTLKIGRHDYQLTFRSGGSVRYSVRVDPAEAGGPTLHYASTFQTGRINRMTVELLQEHDIPVEPDGRDLDQQRDAIRLMIEHLHRTCFYTTEMIASDAGEDPIEMFLFRTQQGHCEYFASALAAMCRSVGIDSRVITGYLASEFDEAAGAYTVRESNAHAWIEAQIEPGHWASFDPSPPDELAFFHEPPSGFAALTRSVLDGLSQWWLDSVVGFNESTRTGMVGDDPLGIQAISERIIGGAGSPAGQDGPPLIVVALLRGVVAFTLTAGLCFAGIQIAGIISRRRTRWREREGDEDLSDSEAALRRHQRRFYGDMLEALRRSGRAKPSWRPGREHARALESVDEPAADSVHSLVELYYRSRFGRELLSDDQLAEAERRLEALRDRLQTLGRQATG